MAGMERFTQRARRVLSLAHQEAERAHTNFIGPEHLLLGLLDEEGGVAGRVLRELGMTTDRVREVVNRISSISSDFDPNRVELASQTQKTLEFAVEEARRLGHHYIGTEHILLGLVRVESAAVEVLHRLGVTEDQIRRQTRRVINEIAAAPQNISTRSERIHQAFILHGQGDQKKTVAALIQVLGLVPVILDIRKESKTGIEYLDKYSDDVALVVIILANNDPDVLRSDLNQSGLRVDYHVVYELGYFRGKLGQNRVCVLYMDEFRKEVESLSDFAGVIYVPLDSAGAWMTQLAKSIQETGLKPDPGNIS